MEHEKGRSKAAATGKRRSKAIFLIHDMNRQSEANLRIWITEIAADSGKGRRKMINGAV